MKRHKKHKAVLSVIMTALICMAGGMTAFAYDSPNTVSVFLEHDLGGDANFITESAESGQMKLLSDNFFTDDSGNVYDISSSDMHNRTICLIELFGLSRRKFYRLLKEGKKQRFTALYGSRRLVIRKEFEKYLDENPQAKEGLKNGIRKNKGEA